MKLFASIALLLAITTSGYSQTYRPSTSTNKTYLETIKGLSYSYRNGIITLKNRGDYDLGTVSIIAKSSTDPSLFGIALFEDGVKKNKDYSAKVYFTEDNGKTTTEVPLNKIEEKSLIFSFDKATRAR
ncbi:hypothetical protein [Pedobacter zeae]|uniref:Uncharacterized protein n=1 Tax=Pedobacter zeae TaxID=1737356 RepID=A0A7W6K7Z6_9SPHI|nr:hypothetical protein [Pedobacter zeae]MBB4106875.1 hypothetical protein [Pedobacter zeae]GGH04290.1 hypothetical protein GCM10007422_19820 [Pedobacter zeae]